ncbi:MAG: DUF2971 domain-containing protein [Elusimicrobiota bacterium]|nr:DUF2971 domain-containing protein [Elusimicrobiota bacterium]
MKELLGHYTNLSSLEKILQRRELQFGSFIKTNDPFESQNLDFDIKTKQNVSIDSSIFFGSDQLKRSFKLLCFSFSKNMRFFYNRPRMWMQYADNHHGCCIILDKNKFDNKFKDLKCKGVVFKKSQSYLAYNLENKKDDVLDICNSLAELVPDHRKIKIKTITDFLNKEKDIVLYSKMSDWKEEREYRYCVYTYSKKNILIDIEDSLLEIVLGEKVNLLYLKMLYTLCKDKNISISHIYWKNGFPGRIKINENYFQNIKDAGIFR